MVKTPRITNESEAEANVRLIIASEDCECCPRSNHTTKMQSMTCSSVVEPTEYQDRECGPRSIFDSTASAVDPADSEDRKCGQRSHTFKMKSMTCSSLIDSTDYEDRECCPRTIFCRTASAVEIKQSSNSTRSSQTVKMQSNTNTSVIRPIDS